MSLNSPSLGNFYECPYTLISQNLILRMFILFCLSPETNKQTNDQIKTSVSKVRTALFQTFALEASEHMYQL